MAGGSSDDGKVASEDCKKVNARGATTCSRDWGIGLRSLMMGLSSVVAAG